MIILYHIPFRNRDAAVLILSWQDQFKIKKEKKNNIRNQYD